MLTFSISAVSLLSAAHVDAIVSISLNLRSFGTFEDLKYCRRGEGKLKILILTEGLI